LCESETDWHLSVFMVRYIRPTVITTLMLNYTVTNRQVTSSDKNVAEVAAAAASLW